MEAISEIPNDWETEDEEVVTVNPHTGEVQENLSSTGAGPQVNRVHGVIKEKPCENCDKTMQYHPPNAALICDNCGTTEDFRLQENRNA
jgi:hypothetical protein